MKKKKRKKRNSNVRFIRVRGRIVPIRDNRQSPRTHLKRAAGSTALAGGSLVAGTTLFSKSQVLGKAHNEGLMNLTRPIPVSKYKKDSKRIRNIGRLGKTFGAVSIASAIYGTSQLGSAIGSAIVNKRKKKKKKK